MKHLLLALAMLTLVGCESKTQYGDCVGVNDEQKSDLTYKPSTRNLIVGIIFFEMVAPPIYVVFDELYCPVGQK